jgi:PEP-CTERM motif
MLSFTNGSVFDLLSVDLAEYSTLFQTPLTVSFIGYKPDGSSVTTELVTDGIIDGTGPLADFQTFYFDKEWTELTRVEIPSWGWSLDNLVVSIPEPSSCALLLAGGLLLWAWRFRK